jgi:phospholipase/carboxylesterase
MYTHKINYITEGATLQTAKAAIIMLHGRGGTAQNIAALANEFDRDDLAVYAPQATNSSWYPYSFMAPAIENEPALSSALNVVGEVVKQVIADGIPADKIFFAGFSQGACLTLEYVARHAQQYGGVIAFTGGLIGEELVLDNYKGDFNNTPILITTGDPDPHVPLTRVDESVKVLKSLNANVTLKVFKGRAHTISLPEINLAKALFDEVNA